MNIHLISFPSWEFDCPYPLKENLTKILVPGDELSIIDEKVSLAETLNSVCAESKCDIILFVDKSVVPCSSLVASIRKKYDDESVVLAANSLVYYLFNTDRTTDTLGKSHKDLIVEYIDDNDCFKARSNLFSEISFPLIEGTDTIKDFDLPYLCAIRRDAIQKCGGFDCSFKNSYFIFLDLYRRLRNHGRFVVLDAPTSYLTVNRNQFSFDVEMQDDFSYFLWKYESPDLIFDFFPWQDYSLSAEALSKVLSDMSANNLNDTYSVEPGTIHYFFSSSSYPNGLCLAREFDNTRKHESIGLRLPYKAGTFKTAILSPKWSMLPEKLLAIILQEALRIADVVQLDRHIHALPVCDFGNNFTLDFPYLWGQYIVDHICVFDFSNRDNEYIYVKYAKNAGISFEKRITEI